MPKQKTNKDKENFLKALEQSLGYISHSCKAANISRRLYYKWIEKDKEFKERVDEIIEAEIDVVENELKKQIMEGNPTSTIFYLKTKGKKRGYSENHTQNTQDKKESINLSINLNAK